MKTETQSFPAQRLPSVDKVMRAGTAQAAVARFGHTATVQAVRAVLNDARALLMAGKLVEADEEILAAEALSRVERQDEPSVRRVFNLTGTVLHTNLGRAILADAAVAAAVNAMRNAIALEFDLGTGKRGERDDHVRGLITEITGAEDASVVNNNAGAVLLVLNALGAGKQAIVSRGELIEIGGSFRLPDIMARAGVQLVEVGTTNRTHLKDYAAAIGPDTAIVMKVHTSNYLIQGFTAAVEAAELAQLARARGVPFVNDLGSGTLADLSRYGLVREPTVQAALNAGSDIVTFSGDKLLGGPQCGIIAGRRDLIAKIAGNPMKRALRLDKIRLAALEATLKLFRDPDRLPEALPVLRYFTRSRAEIAGQAGRLLPDVAKAAGPNFTASVIECASQIGSGALPLESLPSAGIAVSPRSRRGAGTALEGLVSAFRGLPIPVVGSVRDGAFVLDLRCLDAEEDFRVQLKQLDAKSAHS